MSFLDIIPWELSLGDKIARAFMSTKNLVLIRAPAGSGKTSVAIAYLIYRAMLGERGALFLRTKREVEHALGIAKKISEKTDTNLLIMPSPSKEDFCVMALNKELIKYWCPISECERLSRRKYSDLEAFLRRNVFASLSEYVNLLASGKRCPYYVALGLLRKANIVFGTHSYFIRSDLFEKLGKLDIVIVDEAHELLFPKTYEGNYEVVEEGREIAHSVEEQGIALSRYIVSLGRSMDYESAKKLAEYDAYREADGADILLGKKIVKIYPPAILIRDRLRSVRKIVVMSSTLYPSNFFRMLFAKDMEHELIVIPGLIGGRRKIIVVDTNLSLSYRMRNEETYKAYAELIRRIYLKHREKTLVFCPSYKVAEGIAKHLKTKPTDKLGGDLVITVFRGRIAEGIDATGYRVAIMAGLPFPMIDMETREILKLYSGIYHIDIEALENAYSLSSMISALVQAMGRVGRREEGVIYIIDSRAKKYLGNIIVSES